MTAAPTASPSVEASETPWGRVVEELFARLEGWVDVREGWGRRRFEWDGHLDRLLVRTPKGEFMFSPAGDERATEGVLQFYSVPALESVHLTFDGAGWSWYETPAGSFTAVRRAWNEREFERAVDHLADRS